MKAREQYSASPSQNWSQSYEPSFRVFTVLQRVVLGSEVLGASSIVIIYLTHGAPSVMTRFDAEVWARQCSQAHHL